MSLTSFLTDKEVKEKFAQEFVLPDFDLKKEIIAAPLTNHFILVGTAFDYLFRFYLKYLNPKAITETWVAEIAISSGRLLQAFVISEIGKSYYQQEDVWKIIGKGDKSWNMPPHPSFDVDHETWSIQRVFKGNVEQAIDCDLLKTAQKIIEEAKENLSFFSSGKITDELIKSAIKLAQLDPIYRSGYIIDSNIGVIDNKDVEDLRNLISSVNPETFKALDLCLLNPTFGEASRLVGGADADLIIDDTLIDIKTTKFLKFDRKMLNQLIGYYTLYKIGGIGESPHQPEIKKLGIYYSRFNEVYTFDISDIINEDKFADFIKWFTMKAGSTFGNKKLPLKLKPVKILGGRQRKT